MRQKKLNILLITTDTQRTDTLGCMGSSFAYSPNIDRLAKEGVLFEQAYTAAPACMPARCSILSGLHTPMHGCIENGVDCYTHMPNFVDNLKELGYYTMMFGKTHFGPVPASFDLVEDVRGEKNQVRQDFYTKYFEEVGYPQNSRHPNPVPEEFCLDSLIVDRVIYGMEQSKKRNVPFFAFCSILSPHSPLDPPGKWADFYDPAQLPEAHFAPEEWKSLPGSLQQLCGLPRQTIPTDWMDALEEAKGTVADQIDLTDLARFKALYYGSASYCDALVGRILMFLEESNLRENTLVIFTSDHGQQYFDHGFNDKHNFYTESCRVPFIMCLPGILPAGLRCGFASTVDIAPSIVAAAGGSYSASNGFDLFTPLQHGEELPRHCAVSTIQRSMALMAGSYRLEYYMDDEKIRLFDLENDPMQDKDLSQDSRYIAVREYLFCSLLCWRAQLTDITELSGRLSVGGPVAARAVNRLRALVGNEGERRLNEKVKVL